MTKCILACLMCCFSLAPRAQQSVQQDAQQSVPQSAQPGVRQNAQQRLPQSVQLESTISGNQEQPKTIYVLPWQQPVGHIRIPPSSLAAPQIRVSPLDRQQFLRFIAVQQGAVQTRLVNPEQQQ
ncbi:MAG: hypothetical protein KKE30_09600 [Gammaproteobacteria bacterium]|nr:hypothetical protein [Gammaproteobacteria bacterium]MBU1554400.1 hypothetical protein [Gammaproteobacteria bacterium]MBU2071907.1 hypothetical protein [Gammaproteobacteria bacterium]MBU2181768.1 hypothetical protein [Gammaproteobacteria bacterium]MBU2206356.1 hypothetical protein [Gammaproteobacteria bacterium]